MNGNAGTVEVTGTVELVTSSGLGPNSGEITLVLRPENGLIQLVVFGAIIDATNHPNGLEHGVYASFVTMAIAALTSGKKLKVAYQPLDKFRIHGMTMIP